MIQKEMNMESTSFPPFVSIDWTRKMPHDQQHDVDNRAVRKTKPATEGKWSFESLWFCFTFWFPLHVSSRLEFRTHFSLCKWCPSSKSVCYISLSLPPSNFLTRILLTCFLLMMLQLTVVSVLFSLIYNLKKRGWFLFLFFALLFARKTLIKFPVTSFLPQSVLEEVGFRLSSLSCFGGIVLHTLSLFL